jgi:hypothetical protein
MAETTMSLLRPIFRSFFIRGFIAMRSLGCILFIFVLALTLPACTPSPKLVKVKGTLHQNGQPLKIDSNGSVTVVFTPMVEKGQNSTSHSGVYRADNPIFEVFGDGNGIPEGKYKISLICMVLNPTADTKDINDRFGTEKSPIVREVHSPDPLVIDLAKPNSK